MPRHKAPAVPQGASSVGAPSAVRGAQGGKQTPLAQGTALLSEVTASGGVQVPQLPATSDLPMYIGFAATKEAQLGFWSPENLGDLITDLSAMKAELTKLLSALEALALPPAAQAPPSQLPQLPQQQQAPVPQVRAIDRTRISVGGLRLTIPVVVKSEPGSVSAAAPPSAVVVPALTAVPPPPVELAVAASGKGTSPKKGRGRGGPHKSPETGGTSKKGATRKPRKRKNADDSDFDAEEAGNQAVLPVASNAVPAPYTTNFWATMEMYLRPFTEEDVEWARPISDEQLESVCTMPPLGRHYAEVWAEEDEAAGGTAQQPDSAALEPPVEPVLEFRGPGSHSKSGRSSHHNTRRSREPEKGGGFRAGAVAATTNETETEMTLRLLASLVAAKPDPSDDPFGYTSKPRGIVLRTDDPEVAARQRKAVDDEVISQLEELGFLDLSEAPFERNLNEDDEISALLRSLFASYSLTVTDGRDLMERVRERMEVVTEDQKIRIREMTEARQALEGSKRRIASLAKKKGQRGRGAAHAPKGDH